MSNTFASLGLPPEIQKDLAGRGIREPFPVQAATIPDVLAGRDVNGKAPTGSGKTVAFGTPVLARVSKAKPNRPRALILAPTRELAEQIHHELSPVAKAVGRTVAAVYGGVGYGPQVKALRQGVDLLVATPGRLEDLIEKRIVDLGEVATVVVDEADRMADMGFLPAVRRILDQTSKDRQTLFFSATLDRDVARLSEEYQSDPVTHQAQAVDSKMPDATHHFWLVEHRDRISYTAEIVERSDKTIVFTRTRHGADRLAKQLKKHGVTAVAMHGGRNQNQRTRALRSFSTGRAQALVATDVAARGIHVDDVSTVVHYDVAGDHKDYVHRSGRTGRAGATGTVVSLVTPQQRREVTRMQRKLSLPTDIGRPEVGALTAPSSRRPTPRTDRSKTTDQTITLFVGNLPWSTTGDDLDRVFSRFGRVVDTSVAMKRGRSKGYGFVEIPAAIAPEVMHSARGMSLKGRRLKVRESVPAKA